MIRLGHLTNQQIEELLDTESSGPTLLMAEEHIEQCDDCREQLERRAANKEWISDYASCLKSDFTITPDTRFHSRNLSFEQRRQHQIDDYEFKSAQSLLDELKGTAAGIQHHSEAQYSETPASPLFERYELQSIVGIGGMGFVVKAFDTDLRRYVAIKFLLPKQNHDAIARTRFLREARAAAVVLHPNVIGIHEIGETEGRPWFVMPLVVGPTLQQHVAAHGPLPDKEVVRIGLQIASALAAAHNQGLVHRDIKPDNVLLDNRVNRIVVTDFGLARHFADDSLTQTGTLAGTIDFMSPEQTRGIEVDSRSDLFSLGGLLYFIATGTPPFRRNSPMGTIQAISHEQPIEPLAKNPDLSPALSKVIEKLLSKAPDDRFQSATELEQYFERLISHFNHPTQNAIPSLPGVQSASNDNSRLLRVVLGSLVLAVVVFAVAFGMLQSGWPWETPHPSKLERIEAHWRSISSKYGLSEVDEFSGLQSDFRRELEELDRVLSQSESFDLPAFNRDTAQMNEVQWEIMRLNRELELQDLPMMPQGLQNQR